MHDISLDGILKEVLKNTNKLEATLLIIKADFLWEKTFLSELVRWKALIQPRSIHKSFRCRESNWHFSQVGSHNHMCFAKWTLKFVWSVSLCFPLLLKQTVHTHTRAFCPVHFQFDLFYGFLLQLSWKIPLIEPCCEISIRWGCSHFSECEPCSIHISLTHTVQNINCW